MKTIVTCMAIAMAVCIFSCTKDNKTSLHENESAQDLELKSVTPDGGLSVDTISMPPVPMLPQLGKSEEQFQDGKPSPLADWDKKIIKTAEITLELKNYKLYDNTLHKRLKDYGAYISGEEQNETSETITNSLIIKVPVDKFEDLVNVLPSDSAKLINKKIQSSDVTGEVIDTKSRIEAKKQVRDRYLELLKQAKNMGEILQVQHEINDIHEELESAAGRVSYLTHQSAYSTIHLTYFQYINGTPPKDIQPTFFIRLVDAFSNGSAMLKQLLLFMVTIWPLLVVFAFGYLLLKKEKSKPIKAA